MFLALVSKGQGTVFRAVPFREPKIGRALVLFHVGGLDDVSDQVAVRRKVRLVHIAQGGPIFRFQSARRIRHGGRGQEENKHEEANRRIIHNVRDPRRENWTG